MLMSRRDLGKLAVAISILPPGRNARLHGAVIPSASVVIVYGFVAWYGARVCSANSGLLSGFSVGRESTGRPSTSADGAGAVAAPSRAACASATAGTSASTSVPTR